MWRVLLVVFLLTSPGCSVVWYKDFPRPAMTSVQKRDTVSALPAHPGFEQCDLQPPPFPELGAKVGAVLQPVVPHGITVAQSKYYSTKLQGVEMPVRGGKVVFVSRPSDAGVMSQEGLVCAAIVTGKQIGRAHV